MSCLSPIKVRQDKDTPQERDIWVPCGKCAECLSARRLAWAYRIQKEMLSTAAPTFFFTLTYEDDHVPMTADGRMTLSRRDFQLFMKLLRKWLFNDFGQRCRYFVAGEYGPTTARPHYHGFLFGVDLSEKIVELYFRKFWKLGVCIDVKLCDKEASVYAVKDMISVKDHPDGAEDLFYLRSTRPALGGLWAPPDRPLEFDDPRRLTEPTPGGRRVLIPRYLMERWYNEYDLKRIKERAALEGFDSPTLYERSARKLYDDGISAHQYKAILKNRLSKLKDKTIKQSYEPGKI